MKLLRISLIYFGISAVGQAQEAAARPALDKTIPLEKVRGRIDHMAADVRGERLFVAALGNNTVEVIDLKAGKTLRSLPSFAEPQGIAYVPEFTRVFVANGQDGTCRILDGQSYKTISSVHCGDDADNVRYDETASRIYVGYGDGALAVIDAKTGTKLSDIKLSGHPESFRLETGAQRIFVNVPHAGHIAIVDRAKESVTATWPLKEAKSNFPLFLDEANHRLFAGCRNPPRVLVYDIATAGRLVTSFSIGRDTDDMFYDAANKLLYISCGEGVIDVIRQIDPDHYLGLKPISTAEGARTSLFIPELKLLCLAVPRRGAHSAEIRLYRTP